MLLYYTCIPGSALLSGESLYSHLWKPLFEVQTRLRLYMYHQFNELSQQPYEVSIVNTSPEEELEVQRG